MTTDPQTRSLRAVLTVTVETKPDGDYYVDHADFVRHVVPWIEGGLEDRDDIREVTITEQPAPVDRAAVLREAADELGRMDYDTDSNDYGYDTYRDAWNGGVMDGADLLRRMADEEQQPETQAPSLAPMFEGLARLIATSSRDWGQYRVDAWLWAVLVGWDCEEQHEHDETCDDGAAMAEMQEQHGWDDEAVAKARRYRAMVRAITEPAAVAQPGKEA